MNDTQKQGLRKSASALSLFYLGEGQDGNQERRHDFMPTKYCMCLGCGQEQWGDFATTTVPECFACRRTGNTSREPTPKPKTPDAEGGKDTTTKFEDIFLGALRTSRMGGPVPSGSSGPALRRPRSQDFEMTVLRQQQKARKERQALGRTFHEFFRSSRRKSSSATGPERPEKRSFSPSSSMTSLRKFRSSDFDLTALRQSRQAKKAGADSTAEGTDSKPVVVQRLLAHRTVEEYTTQASPNKLKLEERRKKKQVLARARSLPTLPPLPDNVQSTSPSKFPPPDPTGNEMLDSVLVRLGKPKLLDALNRMVKEVNTNKRSIRGAVKDFDLNGDGILSREEMAVGLRRLGVSLLPSELDAIMRAFDMDQNGSVEVEEFIEIMTLYRAHFKLEQPAEKDKPSKERLPSKEKPSKESTEKVRRGPPPPAEKRIIRRHKSLIF